MDVKGKHLPVGTIEAQLEQVNRCQSFEALQRLSNKGDYEAVVELLIQNFHRNKESNKVDISLKRKYFYINKIFKNVFVLY